MNTGSLWMEDGPGKDWLCSLRSEISQSFLASKYHALSPATNDQSFLGSMKRGHVRRGSGYSYKNTAGEQSWKVSQSRSCFIFNHEGLGVFYFLKKRGEVWAGRMQICIQKHMQCCAPSNDKNEVLPQQQWAWGVKRCKPRPRITGKGPLQFPFVQATRTSPAVLGSQQKGQSSDHTWKVIKIAFAHGSVF